MTRWMKQYGMLIYVRWWRTNYVGFQIVVNFATVVTQRGVGIVCSRRFVCMYTSTRRDTAVMFMGKKVRNMRVCDIEGA